MRWRKKIDMQEQPIADYPGKASGADFAAPSIIRETIPGDWSQGKQIDHYVVEVGGTISPARYVRSFFAEITGGNTWAEMLQPMILNRYGNGDVDFAIHVHPASSSDELDSIGRRIAGLLSDLDDEGDVRKIDAMRDEIADLKERQKRIRLNIERSFRVSIQVIASASTYGDLTQLCRGVVQRFASKSIYLKAADGRQLEALQALLPTAPRVEVPKEKYLALESSNVADLYPYLGGSLSHRSGVVLGLDLYGRPVWLDNWHPDLANYHMCIIGRSGAGKTYTIMLIIHRSAAYGRQVGIVDWKGEYGDFLTAIGCPYVALHERSEHRINPYDVEITELPDGTRYVDIEENSNAVQAVAYKMISVYDRSALTGEVKVFIGNGIREQYRDLHISEDPESLFENVSEVDGKFTTGKVRKKMPELAGLYQLMTDSEFEGVKKAAELLKPFTRLGNMPSYSIFDGQSTVELKKAPVFGFAINRLDPEIMRPIGLYITTRWMMERWAKKNPYVQKLLVVEESQNILNDDDEVSGPWAESLYREGRSTNTGVVAVTQGLEVFTRSAAGMAAIKNSPVKIIGIQESIDIESVQGKLALTEGEAHYLVYKARKGDMVVKVDNQSVICKVDASPFEHMLFTSDPNDPKYAERKQYIKELKGAG